MDDVHNPNTKRKVLIVFDDIIADIMANKIFQAIIKELFIRCRKLNICLVFITQSYFFVPKKVRLNSTHYLSIESHKALLLIIQQILIIKILSLFTENVKISHTFSWLLILHYQLIIL